MNITLILYITTLLIGAFIIYKINRSNKAKIKEMQNEIDKLKNMKGLDKYEMKL